jgi:hypothetical protein
MMVHDCKNKTGSDKDSNVYKDSLHKEQTRVYVKKTDQFQYANAVILMPNRNTMGQKP